MQMTLLKPSLYCCIGDASRFSFAYVSDVVDVFPFTHEQRTTFNSSDSSINILFARKWRIYMY